MGAGVKKQVSHAHFFISRTDAAALGVNNKLGALRQFAAQALHIAVLVNILADTAQTCAELCRGFRPRRCGPGDRLPAADPGHRRLMQHDLLQIARLYGSIVSVIRCEVMFFQGRFKLPRDLAPATVVEATPPVNEESRTTLASGLGLAPLSLGCPLGVRSVPVRFPSLLWSLA